MKMKFNEVNEMTIYQLHEYGGEWEDKYDYIIGSYLNKVRAEEEKVRAEQAETLRQQQSRKCADCPIGNFYFDDAEAVAEACAKYCDQFSRNDYENGMDCRNYHCQWDANLYRIETVEVEE